MQWLLQNFGERMRFILQNLRYALGSLYHEFTVADERLLSTITGISARQIRTFLGEPIHTPDFAARLRETDATFRDLKIQSADLYAKKVLLQYMAIRAIQPETVVETRVANGVSSTYILLALQNNERGSLHSVGLNDPQ
jgi:hypothetical protein